MGASLSLEGLRIVVTRPREQADDLVRELTREGAEVLLAPMIKVEPPADAIAVTEALSTLESYDWAVFTSSNGVRAFLPQALRRGTLPEDLKVCAIGEATAAAVRAEGVGVDLIPSRYVAESVIEAFHQLGDISGLRILLARAEGARAVLPAALKAGGADVNDLVVYRTVPDQEGISLLQLELANSRVDLITFTSGSAVRSFADFVAEDLARADIASIGPITSNAIRERGWKVDIEADPYTAAGLVGSIMDFYRNRRVS